MPTNTHQHSFKPLRRKWPLFPPFTYCCLFQMNILCQDEADDHMEECLKLAFQQQKLRSEQCRLHMAHTIETQRADLSADPFLNQVCGVDDNKFCTGMESGTRGYFCCSWMWMFYLFIYFFLLFRGDFYCLSFLGGFYYLLFFVLFFFSLHEDLGCFFLFLAVNAG